ncbi:MULTISPECIES: DUF6879 family protein [unclassified Streptomyces]|uniref:DUF6879 family protein n=1 Tax=unclassified Streptomyces TaxID=2593676 RepID=UPI000DAB9509|nr:MULTISPECIES: DUF6879 family protein [unclassified Streptomyces]PZT72567.1 hypothetical protein DNK55_29070 [Streptomyces sp. AC1-42T]PZT81115.1 hypothetical protein DNK56_02500 [Streptomyces sp. AC1-42W]
MPGLVSFDEIAHLFTDFEHTAWRLETRRGYASDREGERFKAFVRGVLPEVEPGHSWNVNVRAQTAAGKRFSRVRVVDDPPTDGQLFLMATARGNIESGEDIRVLPRAGAKRLGLPDFDLWLFDSRVLVRFHIDDTDTTVGVEVTEDPVEVLATCRARDAAWHFAVPAAEAWARVRSST